MDVRQLELFVAVADELSFTRAAQRLHTVQSAVSAGIAQLERELGVRLFDRTRQRVAVSTAGKVLLPRARAVLDAMRAARDSVDQVKGGLTGTIDVGTMISVGIVDLPGLLGRFHKEYPGVTVRLRTMTTGTAGLVAALTDGTLDLAFVSLPGKPPAGVTVRQLAAWPVLLVCRADHPLASGEAVTLSQLADQPFIDFPEGYGNRTVVDQAFAAAGISRRVRLEVADLATAAGFVRNGLGIAFLPSFIAPRAEDLRVLRVSDHPMTWRLGVAISRTRSKSAAVLALLGLLEAQPDLVGWTPASAA